MVAASAMLMVIEALTPCTTAGLPRFGGGAVLVRPVTSFEPVPFIHLGPTTSIRTKPERIQQTGAQTDTEAHDAPSSQQCEAPFSIA
jgi:hypothetical protein